MTTKSLNEHQGWDFSPGTLNTKKNPPDPEGTREAFSRIGYSLEEALSDLIDNSIDANASSVLIRFFYNDADIIRIAIADDGHGMSSQTLWQAMQFGAKIKHNISDLGKFGMGLKSASLSQCRSLMTMSRANSITSGARWTKESIGSSWNCEILRQNDCDKLLDAGWAGLNLNKKGTLILWDRLTSIRAAGLGIDTLTSKIIKRVQSHLGLHFHRFLENGKLKILLDCRRIEGDDSNMTFSVLPLDPFSYSKSGNKNYPKQFNLEMGNFGKLELNAHIWPKKSKEAGYKLGGGKTSARQGFYFYRNNRLIQAGGWSGFREDDTEPHFSLARVCIDLPPSLDSAFSVSVQKSKIIPPYEFLEALQDVSSGEKTFRGYVSDAENAYREKGHDTKDDFPLAPHVGINKRLRSRIGKIIAGKDNKTRPVDFKWKKLDKNEFFRLDRQNIHKGRGSIILNSDYRKKILSHERASAADAPLIKLLLFLLVSDDLDRERISGKRQAWIADCNAILISALR